MELKKNPKYDLNQKSPLFFSIGLVVALLCITLAFEWKGEYDKLVLKEPSDPFEEPYMVMPTAFPKPKPPKPIEKKTISKPVIDPVFIVGEELDDLADEPSIHEIDFDDVIIPDLPPEPEEPEFLLIVESMPEFPGGTNAFYKYISEEIKYPNLAKMNGVTGKVFVQFIIDKDGSITDVVAIKGIGFGCDKEAVRVLENAPKWIPGKQRGREVRVRMVLPITFSLN
jgi:protein TonB